MTSAIVFLLKSIVRCGLQGRLRSPRFCGMWCLGLPYCFRRQLETQHTLLHRSIRIRLNCLAHGCLWLRNVATAIGRGQGQFNQEDGFSLFLSL
ncbi:hypothetical protein RchiOBHm_Chr1g0369641 [Rosa chinensis]|uniref:Uncharacterized protein n=1 Tax=Rosa chinensis TaxID=74649 RepID=A0A2P6SL18_ROSCH|nr:hypothetical protein RchiOBHm_Chr1g0369641 [Rosa chinensis]